MGLKGVLLTADGEAVETPRHSRKAEKRLVNAQQRLSRRQQGSKRREKARVLVAKRPQQVKRQRRDFPHQTALSLVRQYDGVYDVVYLADWRVANLVRNPHLATSLSAAGWAALRTILAATAAWAGRQVVAVPPAFTWQDCSAWRARVAKSLSLRPQVCPCCGLILDRDQHATSTRPETCCGPGRPLVERWVHPPC